MITLKEAINLVKKNNSNKEIIGISETDDAYIIAIDDGKEGYESVNKNTGEESFIWIWEYGELVLDNKVTVLDLSEDRAS